MSPSATIEVGLRFFRAQRFVKPDRLAQIAAQIAKGHPRE